MTSRLLALTVVLVAAASAACAGGDPSPRAQAGKPETTASASPDLVRPAPRRGPATPSDDVSAPVAPIGQGPATDALQFSIGGMVGDTEVRWDPVASRLFYQSHRRGETSERWDRQPSRDEWARFWTVMDAAGVWDWKTDYGTALHTDCVQWSLLLRHGNKSVTSQGCSLGPDDAAFQQVTEAVTGLRGDASAAAGQALDFAKSLEDTSSWETRMETVGKLAAMGPGASPAAPALIGLLGAPPFPWAAAPGPEPVAVARAVAPLLAQAERTGGPGRWDEAVGLFDQVLARDPQNEQAARGRATAVGVRELIRQRAATGRDPRPSPPLTPEARAGQEVKLAEAAQAALGRIGPSAVPALVRALADANPHRRRRAARALEEIGPDASSAVPALTAALEDRTLRVAAARALVRIDPANAARQLPVLITGLSDPDRDVALLSVEALAELRTPAAVPALIHALDDNRTHELAVEGLRRLGPRAAAAVPALVQTLQDGREAERIRAAFALGEMGVAAIEAMPALIERLSDDRGSVRAAAARALGAMGPAASAAIPRLIDTLRYGDGGYDVGSSAGIALSQIGPAALPAVIAALKCERLPPAAPMSPSGYLGPVYPETENVRVLAARTLLGMRRFAKDAIPALRESLRDPSPRVREAAARALKEIDRP